MKIKLVSRKAHIYEDKSEKLLLQIQIDTNKSIEDKNKENIKKIIEDLSSSIYKNWRKGKFLKKKRLLALDGHICHSYIEVEIDNFLHLNSIPHTKPEKAILGQYYTNSKMFPDWIIGTTYIEFMGLLNNKLSFYNDYYNKFKYKITDLKRRKIKFLFLTPDDNWSNIILKRFNIQRSIQETLIKNEI